MIPIGILTAAATSSYSFLLDQYPNAAAAYSLRKLRAAYTGNCIQVRRSSDNTTQNIGFINNILDTTTLLAFCGSGSGFITIWYDQSGNGRDVTQSTALNQPFIVSLGVLNLSNGKPAIFFTRNENDRLSTNGIISGNISRTQIAVYQPTAASSANAAGVWGQGFNGVATTWSYIQSRSTPGAIGDPYFAGYAQDLGNGLTTQNTIMKIGSFFYNGSTGYLWKNNTQLTSGSLTLNTAIADITQIGASGGGSGTSIESLEGNISECILYLNNQLLNSSGINNNINSFYTIY